MENQIVRIQMMMNTKENSELSPTLWNSADRIVQEYMCIVVISITYISIEIIGR